jgi:hypothetical protein
MFETYVKPFGDLCTLGTKPDVPTCPFCDKKSTLGGAVFEDHVAECTLRAKIDKKPKRSRADKSVSKSDFAGDLRWRFLFHTAIKERVDIGDGYRICRSLYRYALLLFEGSHSSSYFFETVRMLLQTNAEAGVCSPRVGWKIMLERFFYRDRHNMEGDLDNEYIQRVLKPGLKGLSKEHTPQEAVDCVDRLFPLCMGRRAIGAGVALDAAKRRRKRVIARKIITQGPEILMLHRTYSQHENVKYEQMQESYKFHVKCIEQVNVNHMLPAIKRELIRMNTYARALRDKEMGDQPYMVWWSLLKLMAKRCDENRV